MSADAELQTLRRTFEGFDVDGSNTIDVSELRDVMEHLGVMMSDEQLWELVGQVDKNKNGELEFEEFHQLISMWKEASKFRLFDSEGVKSLTEMRVKAALQTNLLLTDAWGRCVFDAIVGLTACCFFILVTVDDARRRDTTHFSQIVMTYVAVAIFALDMLVSAFTVHITEQKGVVDEWQKTVPAYLRGWFIPDLLSVIPWEFVFGGTFGIVVRHLQLIKLFKVMTFWRQSGRMAISSTFITFHYKVLPITILVFQLMLLVHLFTVTLMYIKKMNNVDPSLLADSGAYPYIRAVYFVIYTLGTVGFGDVLITGTVEKWYACLALFGALFANGFIVGKLISIMQKANFENDRVTKLRATLAALEHFEIPRELQDEVLQFQDHVLGHKLSATYASVIEGLPEEMQVNISLFVKLKMISSSPDLARSHYTVQVALAEKLVNQVVLPQQNILAAGESVTTMFFIAHGFVDIFSPQGGHLTTLKTGDYFGEEMPFENTTCPVSVKALTYSDLWCLHRDDFLPLLDRFPRFRRIIEDLGRARSLSIFVPKSRSEPLLGGEEEASSKDGDTSSDSEHDDILPRSLTEHSTTRAPPPPTAAATTGTAVAVASLDPVRRFTAVGDVAPVSGPEETTLSSAAPSGFKPRPSIVQSAVSADMADVSIRNIYERLQVCALKLHNIS